MSLATSLWNQCVSFNATAHCYNELGNAKIDCFYECSKQMDWRIPEYAVFIAPMVLCVLGTTMICITTLKNRSTALSCEKTGFIVGTTLEGAGIFTLISNSLSQIGVPSITQNCAKLCIDTVANLTGTP